MADEIKADICGANRYNPMMWPCSSPVLNDIGSFFGYDHHMVDLKSIRSCEDDDFPACLVSADDVFFGSSLVSFQDIQKSLPNQLFMDPKAFQSFNLPSSIAASDWNPTLLSHGNERNQENNDCLTQDEITSTMNYIRDEMGETQEETTMMDSNPSSNCCQSFIESSSSDVVSAQSSYHPCSSSLLFDNNGTTMATTNYQSTSSSSFMANSSLSPVDELLVFSPPCPSTWSKLSSSFAAKPSLPKQQALTNTSFWNASTNNGLRTSFLPAPNSETLVPGALLKEKYNCTTEIVDEKVEETPSLVTKTTSEPPFKRPRLETPSPLPTFKVRKEKLGDRITALQQLVSPFGKTDTASVLHEAVGYIKFLHDQVNVLSTPYMKNRTPINQAPQMVDKLMDNNEGPPKQDLKSRGLCLVPISSTFPVAHEPTTEFWTPSFGGTFR